MGRQKPIAMGDSGGLKDKQSNEDSNCSLNFSGSHQENYVATAR